MSVQMPPMEAAREHDWLAGAQAGEAWALERLFQAHHPAIHALCHRMLGCPEDAEDAVQATFIQAFRSLPQFNGKCALKTWLYRIAVNQSIDLLRRRAKAPLPLDIEMPSADTTPAVAERLAIRAAMERLQPEHRAILILRFWEDLSYQEIAAVLRVPLPTVKMRLSRAKSEFQRKYGDATP